MRDLTNCIVLLPQQVPQSRYDVNKIDLLKRSGFRQKPKQIKLNTVLYGKNKN